MTVFAASCGGGQPTSVPASPATAASPVSTVPSSEFLLTLTTVKASVSFPPDYSVCGEGDAFAGVYLYSVCKDHRNDNSVSIHYSVAVYQGDANQPYGLSTESTVSVLSSVRTERGTGGEQLLKATILDVGGHPAIEIVTRLNDVITHELWLPAQQGMLVAVLASANEARVSEREQATAFENTISGIILN